MFVPATGVKRDLLSEGYCLVSQSDYTYEHAYYFARMMMITYYRLQCFCCFLNSFARQLSYLSLPSYPDGIAETSFGGMLYTSFASVRDYGGPISR